jgi:hypothetical protein
VSWSLNEIEALAKKAARGAGFTWGQAEEVGKATRWLEARGLPGAATLADYLAWWDAEGSADMQPDLSSDPAGAPAGAICPVLAGIMLSDGLWQGDKLVLANVRAPLLLLPFLAATAAARGSAIGVDLGATTLCVAPDESLCAAALPQPVETATVALALGAAAAGDVVPAGLRSDCPEDAAATLTVFATRTYAPATEESRIAGAGAGLTDND